MVVGKNRHEPCLSTFPSSCACNLTSVICRDVTSPVLRTPSVCKINRAPDYHLLPPSLPIGGNEVIDMRPPDW
ncbi:uncharacterized protein BDW47DRAFT_112929 [Aspergillus candidus]|uniref:Uncharacterized protein n=1 Tax=Aspergillus candidus TaxID=41067 RepID=A0A2I2F0B9_ASPCN|nr:hypothetical protein BDW47DRAFT_112929 [Aspergillus candidus]PLB34072.1 hypothetical protein BDW47DRAFT_112929 [Aspergillus candidus]